MPTYVGLEGDLGTDPSLPPPCRFCPLSCCWLPGCDLLPVLWPRPVVEHVLLRAVPPLHWSPAREDGESWGRLAGRSPGFWYTRGFITVFCVRMFLRSVLRSSKPSCH